MENLIQERKNEFIYALNTIEEKYNNDNRVFDKVLFLIDWYKDNNGWPYVVDDLIYEIEDLLGDDIIFPIMFYKEFIKNKEVQNALNLSNKVRSEIEYISIIFKKLIAPTYIKRKNPLGLDTINFLEVIDNRININILRNDNEAFTIELDKSSVKYLSEVINSLLEEFNKSDEN